MTHPAHQMFGEVEGQLHLGVVFQCRPLVFLCGVALWCQPQCEVGPEPAPEAGDGGARRLEAVDGRLGRHRLAQVVLVQVQDLGQRPLLWKFVLKQSRNKLIVKVCRV